MIALYLKSLTWSDAAYTLFFMSFMWGLLMAPKSFWVAVWMGGV